MTTSTSWLLALALAASSLSVAAPLSPADREAKEKRLVEIYKVAIKQKGPPTPEAEKMMGELKGLLFELAGVDAANRSPDSGKKLAETQGEILKRRDPELAAEMLRETQRYACRSKQIDGKVGLKTVFRAQESWKEEHKKFSSKLEELELSPDLLRRYDFKLVKGDAKRFFATATGKDEMAGDAWEIDEKGEPKNTNNVCDQFLAP